MIIGVFKNKKGVNGIILDPLDISKQFKGYEGRYKTKLLRFDGRSLRNHSSYKYFDTTGPIYEHGKLSNENYIELHENRPNVLMES